MVHACVCVSGGLLLRAALVYIRPCPVGTIKYKYDLRLFFFQTPSPALHRVGIESRRYIRILWIIILYYTRTPDDG